METRVEQLFDRLFNVLDELSELESSEIIFDSIVDHLAEQTEYHMGQADTFKSMLDTFRHDNPAETVPERTVLDQLEDAMQNQVAESRYEELYGGMNDINRQYMLEDRDNLMEFLRNAHFPDKLDS